MAKHKKKKDREERPPAPTKFGGFQPLAAGLGDLKAKLDADKKAEQDKQAAAGKPPPKAPPRPVPPPPRPAPNEPEDDLSFHRMMSGVVPLEAKSGRVPVGDEARDKGGKTRIAPAELRAKAQADAKEVLDHLHRLVDEPVRFEVTDDGKRVEGRRLDTPPSLLRELRRGQLPIDGRLDLHGLAAEAARERVVEFLRTMRARGERSVLVIHGKGEHSRAGGVLRGEIAAWLSQGSAREHVAAFATAREEDGGEGAVYVALRR
jgi:DNA-nicking Smr family endonuclease